MNVSKIVLFHLNHLDFTGKNFKQETSVFSYYLVKGGILMNLDKFFKFCCANNKRLLQFMNLFNF